MRKTNEKWLACIGLQDWHVSENEYKNLNDVSGLERNCDLYLKARALGQRKTKTLLRLEDWIVLWVWAVQTERIFDGCGNRLPIETVQ